jgi:DNA-binding IscR family transcriptional regulator
VRSNWNRINLALHEALDRISLAEMTGAVRVPRPTRLVQLSVCKSSESDDNRAAREHASL